MQGKRDRHHGAPGMPEHDGLLDPKLRERVLEQGGMGARRPQVARSGAVAVAGSVKDDHRNRLESRSTKLLIVKSWIRVPLPWISTRGSPWPRSM